MIQTVQIGHYEKQITCFLHGQKPRHRFNFTDVELEELFYLDLGTLIPEALSKHFIAAPTAVSN